MDINTDTFITSWNKAHSVWEIAQEFKITVPQVYTLSRFLRSKGHDLKKFKNIPKKITEQNEKDFIEIWNESNSIKDVCDKTGYTRSKVIGWSFQLRKRGHTLKSFKRIAGFLDPQISQIIKNIS